MHNKVTIGGGEQSLINLWNNIDRNKFECHLAVPKFGSLSEKSLEIGLNVDYIDVPKLKMSNFFKIIYTLIKLERLCKNNDINIIHSYTPRNNIIAAILGKFKNIPVIWHERNMIFGGETDISRKFILLPDSIICNSMAIAERFRTKRGIPSKINVILNGVDTSIFCPGDVLQSVYHNYSLDGKKVVGLISNFSTRKKPEYFLEACSLILKKIPDTKFFIVGGEFTQEDKGRHDELVRKAKRLNIYDNAIFTGFVNDVSEIIKAFDLGVAVTEKEACSRAILEMMASGKPVVAFNTGGNSELIEHGITGTLVKFGDIVGLADSIIELLVNEEKRKKMGLLAAKRIRKYFDVRLNAERTTKLYSDLLKNST